jgi:hypothetical protein
MGTVLPDNVPHLVIVLFPIVFSCGKPRDIGNQLSVKCACSSCSAANSAFFAEDFSSCSVEDDADLDKTFLNDATPDPTPQTEKSQ